MADKLYRDRVKQESTITGTGDYLLGNSVGGFQDFGDAYNNNEEFYYFVTDGTDFEVGAGTYSSGGDSISRDTILASSNSDNAVSWSAGTKTLGTNIPAAVLNDIITGVRKVVLTGTTTYTLDGSEKAAVLISDQGSATTITVPPESTYAFDDYTEIAVYQYGAGQVTFVAGSGVTINKDSSYTLLMNGQHSTATLFKTGTNEWVVFGGLEPA